MTDPTARLSAALADRYAIEHELGAGGMATVYLAEDFPALKRGLGAAREHAARRLERRSRSMSFRTRPAGAELGIQSRETRR
jgi:hypothetical protein